ncbi:hypothetical protein [Candidatus Magnetobacterium casense]|uniref:XRE family transcriptional regulator n=1 Tax=Candidatus Magnetobacterium casense TaxID=1455061 RepID=A0ABS6S2Z1_9BACT|nr:hypothetical protein [Candidatus Magnetobacterium casensis]MBV6343205.1 hypothetical protein [Candidatus Magnetobacterium casensis]
MQGIEIADLIAALEAERVRRELDHRGFSTLLGIHESAWCRIRTGQRAPTLDTLTIILKKLPELKPVVCSYMTQRQISENARKNDGEQGELGQLSTPTTEKGRKT